MTDLLIVGGGIMGLWAALIAGRAGMRVTLVERDRIGAGASGGLLGALMPHTPDRWNDKKQFQFEALTGLEPEIRRLEAITGLSAGYRRTGRLIPLAKPHLRDIALRQAADAAVNWSQAGAGYGWQTLDAPPPGLFRPSAVAHGVVFDALAARVSPRGLLALLSAALAHLPLVTIREGCGLKSIDPRQARVVLSDGTTIAADAIVLATGVESFALLDGPDFSGVPSGTAVKGQAALLKADLDPSLPILYSDGVYVIAHDDGGVAIGSTSERDFADPLSTDARLDDLLDKAARLVPVLDGAPVLERWAGLRPRAIGRDPMAGPHPDHPRLHLLTGGFKISFGIAHRLAAAVIGGIAGTADVPLPVSFLCESHLALRSQTTGG